MRQVMCAWVSAALMSALCGCAMDSGDGSSSPGDKVEEDSMRSALSPSFDETTCSAAEAAAQERYPDVAREYDIHRYAEGRATLQVSSVGAVVDYYTRVIGERRAVRADALMRYRNESEMGGASMGTIFAVEDSLQSLAVIVVEASLTLCQLWHYSPYHPEPIQADMLDELSALARLTRETSDEVHAATTHAD